MKNTIIQWDVVSLVNKYKTEEQFNVIYLNVCFFLDNNLGDTLFYVFIYTCMLGLSFYLLFYWGGGGWLGEAMQFCF